jgi:hypothetical protein
VAGCIVKRPSDHEKSSRRLTSGHGLCSDPKCWIADSVCVRVCSTRARGPHDCLGCPFSWAGPPA